MDRRITIALLALALVLLAATPALAADRDGDGLRDGFEARYGVTSPDLRDSDGDGVIDAAEDNDQDRLGNLGEQRFGTDPGDRDTDDDGRTDDREDADGNGRSNALEQDRRPVPARLRPTLRMAPGDNNRVGAWCGATIRSATVRRCHFGDTDSETTVVLMGDSHANALLAPFKRSAEQQGWHLVTLIKGACIPLPGLDNGLQFAFDRGKTCRTWRRDALAWLRARRDPADLIVITHSDRYVLVDGRGDRIAKSRWPQHWRAGLGLALEQLPKPSKVLILGDVPTNRGDPVRCLRHHRGDMSACVTRRRGPAQRPMEPALRAGAAAGGAQFATLYNQICTYDPCPLVQGDIMIWRDKTHLTATFSELLTPAVRSLLTSALR